MKILFVCTGNTCRSVLAELLLRRLAADRGVDWHVRSVGVLADPTLPLPEEVRTLARELGFKDFHHQSRPISTETVKWADLILTMTDSHMREVWRRYPEAKGRTHLLKEHAGLGPEDIDDPIGQSLDEYRRTLTELRQALARLIDEAAEPPRGAGGAGRGA